MPDVISVDFETFYSKKLKYSLKGMIAEQYCKHPLFDPYLISVSDGKQCWAGSPKDFNWDTLTGNTLLSQNRYFDNSVYDEMVVRGWAPQVKYKDWYCTADMTSYLCNRRALDHAVEFLLGIKLSKTTRSDADNKKWPEDFTPQQRTEMLDYARKDAYYCWLLWDKFSAQWPEWERQLSNMTIDQGRFGVQIDAKLLDQYICWSHEMLQNTEKLIPWIIGAEDEEWEDFNSKPTSTKCIAEMCRKEGIPCPPVKAHEGEEAYQEWEATYGAKHSWIGALTSWRSINKLYKTFLTVKARLRNDNTMPFGLKYFGAHTGRWSGDANINFQNMRKIPVVCNEKGLMETDEKRVMRALDGKESNAWIRYKLDFRALIVPRPGKKMIVSDLAQIEPRVLAWCAGDMAKLDMVRSGMSVYEAHARTFLGWVGGNLKKENPGLYAESKARELALGYGAGWEKFIAMAALYTGLDLTENDPEWIEVPDPATGELKKVSGYGQRSKQAVTDFRAQNTKITDLWKRLDEAFKRSIGGEFALSLPSGRKMIYRDVKLVRKIVQDPETKKPKSKIVFTAEVGGRRVETYGGKLTENLVQAVARDVFAEGLLNLQRAGIRVLWSSHDEAICEVDQNVKAKDVEHEMSQCPEWISGLPLAAEAKEVPHYLK